MNPALFSALASGARVVTATRRLRHELVAAYDKEQLGRGQMVWPTPSVNTWDGWIQALWSRHKPHSREVLLSTAQTRQLLGQIIEQDLASQDTSSHSDTRALWNISATASTALGAWQLCHQWQIPYTGLKHSANEDHARFGRWAGKLYARLRQQSWVSQDQLPDRFIEDRVYPQEETLLLGFDQFNRQQQAFIRHCRSGGLELREIDTTTKTAVELKRYSFESQEQEWQAIGAWARQQIEQHGRTRLGIITPDIESIRPVATRALREQLVPGYFAEPTPDPFHFSRGDSLARVPAISSALACLSLLGTIEYPQLENVFLSRYWGDADEQLLRAGLLLELRQKLAFRFDLYELLKVLGKHFEHRGSTETSRRLLGKLSALQVLRKDSRQPQGACDWRDLFAGCLSLLGWPGGQLDSEEYQALQGWESCLEEWVRLDMVSRPLAPGKALNSLANHCQETQFQARPAHQAPVQIMGVLETAGLEFDAVWLAGFDDSAWPATAAVNPFIPISLQIEQAVPAAIPALDHAQARDRTEQLCGLADEVNFSHACIQEDIKRSVSPLMPRLDASPGSELPRIFSLNGQIRNASPALVSQADPRGLPYDEPDARGGTGLIQKQSACPFAAYAQYRLGAAEDDRPEIGMDNLQRGSLLHRIMESLWNQMGDSETLLQHAEEGTLDDLVRSHAREQIAFYARNSGLGEGYRETELARLTSLIFEWLLIELGRPPFRVIATEYQTDYRAADLRLKIKVDRIDEISATGDGSASGYLIMDYKTGKCSLADWAGERPAQPQIPLYYLALQAQQKLDTHALAFAQVRREDSAFIGISREEHILPEVKSLAHLSGAGSTTLKKAFPDWEALGPGWSQRIEQLAGEFRRGEAEVDPQRGACSYCQFAPLCRIHTRHRRMDEHDPD